MSGIHGLFQHRNGYFYTTLEEDFCDVFKGVGKNEVCRAYITSIFEQLANKQYDATGEDIDIWVYMSLPELARRMRNAYSERTIHKELQGMIADGYLEKRRAIGKATMEYKLNIKKIRFALLALPEKQSCNSATYHLANLQEPSSNITTLTLQNCKNDLAELQPRITYRLNQEETVDNTHVAQAASALAQSTHETANGENDAPTPTLSGHLPGDASDSSEHHVLPAIPGIPGDHRSADVSVDPQIVNGGDNGSDNNNLRDDHNASRHDNRVLDVPRRLEAPPSCEVSEQTPTFSVPPTDEVPPLVLPPNTPSTPGRVEREAAPASGAKPQRKPKVATGKQSTIGQSRISAIIDCMDATIQQLTGDPQFCFSRSKKAQDIIWDTLIKDRKEGQGVTPTMLRATITRMYNTPKDPRTGFDWKENMSIAAICNNFDKFSIGLAAKQPPKVAPVELDAEALEEERRRLEFAIKHAERWAKPAPMAPAPHAVVPIVAKGSGR